MEDSNYIIVEIDINEDNINKDVRIINSFENFKREKFFRINMDDEKKRATKEKCKIKINDKIIPFNYFYKFDKQGKYNIRYSFNEYLSKIDFMFFDCNSLTKIDLSNFNTENVTDMNHMFHGCDSLSNVNLSNFNTEKVTNMSCMFNGCNSLTNIDLSYFNTKNITDMNHMFNGCNSLENIDLSNFNTEKVTNMSFCSLIVFL